MMRSTSDVAVNCSLRRSISSWRCATAPALVAVLSLRCATSACPLPGFRALRRPVGLAFAGRFLPARLLVRPRRLIHTSAETPVSSVFTKAPAPATFVAHVRDGSNTGIAARRRYVLRALSGNTAANSNPTRRHSHLGNAAPNRPANATRAARRPPSPSDLLLVVNYLLIVFAAAVQVASSCEPVPPEQPMAPINLPPSTSGMPPREAMTSSSVKI